MNAPHDTPMTPSFPSRLPQVGTTIFTVMSALAAEKGAVNLGQGFPDFGCDPRIVDAVSNAMRDGHIVRIEDTAHKARWPEFERRAASQRSQDGSKGSVMTAS